MSPRAAVVYDCLFPFTSGGGERVYRRIAETLVERGYVVDFVTRVQWEGPPPAAAFRIVPVWEGEIYDADGTRRIASAVGFARAVRRHFRGDRDYDLVIASALPVLTLLGVRAGLGPARRRLVADWLEVWRWAEWRRYSGFLSGTIAWFLQGIGARSAPVHTVNSAFTARRLRAAGGRGPIVELGLVDFGGPSQPVRPAVLPPMVAVVGRLIPDKRVDLVLRSLVDARREIPDLTAIVVGDGPDRSRLEGAVRDLGLGDAVRFAGRVSDAELEEIVAGATASVSGSRREGFGLVVVEAAARGVPSVVVDAPGNAAAELIAGTNGRAVAESELAAGIVEVVRAGDFLRQSTSAWYREASGIRGLEPSIDAVLAAVPPARAAGPGKPE